MPTTLDERLGRIAALTLRYSLVLFFIAFGLYKFTPEEAANIQDMTEHSILLFWVNPLLGRQGGSNLIGVVEVVTGLMIAARRVAPKVSAYGSLLAAFALANTLSFLATTPGLDLTGFVAGFLVKDITLLGAALWTAAEAFTAARCRTRPSPGLPPLRASSERRGFLTRAEPPKGGHAHGVPEGS